MGSVYTEVNTKINIIPPFSYDSYQNKLFNANGVHHVGLQNIGSSSYMNATLQCLSNVKELTNKLLSENVYKQIKKDTFRVLSNAYIELLDNLWKSNRTEYSPKNFKSILEKKDQSFKGNNANDPRDLIIFLLETLHTELNKVNPKNIIFNNVYSSNFNLAFQNYVNFFKLNYDSSISGLFYGTQNSIMQCCNCNYSTNSIQCFNILIFHLEDVRKYKNYLQNLVSIIDCFQYNERFEMSTGQNQIICNNCRRKANAINRNKIIISPKILIINLNRGKGNKFNIKLYFEENLDVSNYVFNSASPKKYELIGVISLYGPSGESGHFVAYCKCKTVNYIGWYKYDDEKVAKADFNEILNYGTPYLLFYHCIK